MKRYMVDKSALEHNIRILLEKAGSAAVWGVIKGDGYGLGAVEMARLLSAHGIEQFAVTDVAEVRALREAGFLDNPILMMEAVCDPEEINELLDHQAILSVGSWAVAAQIDAQAAARSAIAQTHIKIDTGMGRYGFLPQEVEELYRLYRETTNIAFTGIYTHFSCAGDPVFTQKQYDAFQRVVQELQAAGFETGMVHCCDSDAFWRYPNMHCDAVRLGSAVLGRVGYAARAGLKPVGYCEAAIEEVRTIPAGHSVGYGAAWVAKRETKTAVLPVGYIHGFAIDRGFDTWGFKDCLRGVGRYVKAFLKKKALYVSINGRACRVLGHVGMVNMVVDVTDVDCAPGDLARVEINPLLVKNLEIVYF